MYSLMNRQFRDSVRIMSKIRGVAFDSGPARVGFCQGVSVMASFVKGWGPFRYVVAFFWALAMWFYTSLNAFGNWILGTRCHRCLATYDTLLEEQPLCPQLFLYSKSDSICSYSSIRAFARSRRAKGVPVEEVVWEDSQHVQHFPRHKQRYVSSVVDFMRRCLEGTMVATLPVGKKQD